MADGTEFRTNRAGVTPPPADTEAPPAPTRPVTIEEAERRFVPGHRGMMALNGVGEVFQIAGPLRGSTVSQGDLLAMQVVLRAMAMTTYPNNRDEEPVPGTTDPEKPAC